MNARGGAIRRKILLVLILFFGLPVVGVQNYFVVLPKVDENLFYGSVKGLAIGPDNIPRSPVETAAGNTANSGTFARKVPVRVDVYYSPPGLTSEAEILEKEGIVVFPEDDVQFFPDPRLGVGTRITVLRATQVVVNDTGVVSTYRTWSQTVGEFLRERDLGLGKDDVMANNSSATLKGNTVINITRADDRKVVESIGLPFNVIVKDDPNLPNGRVSIRQQGGMGERQKLWEIVKRDGQLLRQTLLSDTVVKQPQDRLVLRGTKPVTFQGPYYDWITAAAQKYGADPDWMFRVMMCESGGDPYALNPGPTSSATYYGLFQYNKPTWSASGWGDHDIYDPYAQINAAAKAWPSRYTKWPQTSRACGDIGR